MNEEEKIKHGDENVRGQMDETIMNAGKIIGNPSSSYDELVNAMWHVDVLKKIDSVRFVLKIFPNSKKETLTHFFYNIFLPETIIITDGHPLYPNIAET